MPSTARPERATAQSRIKRTLTMIGKPKSSVSVAQKRAKALFTAETKENVSVPSGSDFALTPKGAWGAALIVEEKKRPKSHAVSKRASPRKQGQWAGADSPAVEQHGRAPRIAAARYPPLAPEAHVVAQGCDGVAYLSKRRRTSTGFGHAASSEKRTRRVGERVSGVTTELRNFGWLSAMARSRSDALTSWMLCSGRCALAFSRTSWPSAPRSM